MTQFTKLISNNKLLLNSEFKIFFGGNFPGKYIFCDFFFGNFSFRFSPREI